MQNFIKKMLLGIAFASSSAFACQLKGELKTWHALDLDCAGPAVAEADTYNPFLGYRMNVTFRQGSKVYVVPGFFAADGNAAESSTTKGNIWRAHFAPDSAGPWTYEVSFRRGENIAISLDPAEGEAANFDGESGSFEISSSDKTGVDFRAQGRLTHIGERYMQHLGSKKRFLKVGIDEPENFLAYKDFDQTKAGKKFPIHTYSAHTKDWKSGDPTWKGGRGKGIIGALNYMSSQGVNSMYFLTYNVGGDGSDVWPWTSSTERKRFDVSKLAQWEIVFRHMDKMGIMLHVVLSEMEIHNKLSKGELGIDRKLFYREMMARFSHHLAITWNIGEEFNLAPARAEEFGAFLKALDPYDQLVVVHTGPKSKEKIFAPLLGSPHIDGASLQVVGTTESNNGVVRDWVKRSRDAGKVWVVAHDECGPVGQCGYPDSEDSEHYKERSDYLWGTLLGEGAGVEWIFFAKKDKKKHTLNNDEFRSRARLYRFSKVAYDFFHQYLPFWEMNSANNLSDSTKDFVMATSDHSTVALYSHRNQTSFGSISLKAGRYTVDWYHPKDGGALQKGSITEIQGGSMTALGKAPANKNSLDWVILLRRKD
jgi:hypothetical protein